MEIPILADLAIIFSLSILVILVFVRLKVPAITGFLLTGILAGPHALALIHEEHIVELMAEFGVVLLLFTIGIEFSLEHLVRIKKQVFIGGTFQVLFTVTVGITLAFCLGFKLNQAIFIGFLLSLSSTAIVLKILQDRAEMETHQGKLMLAILIFQDIAAIPMMLMTPKLAGVKVASNVPYYWVLAKIVLVVILVILAARYLVPFLLAQVVKTRIRELFLLAVITLCIGVAWISASIGLSLALGAFIAGLIIAESDYSHQAMGYVLPFKDIFTSLFFVSVGMLLNVEILLHDFPLIIGLFLLSLVVKTILAGLSALILGYSAKIAILAGFGLAQIGEFALVVSKLGLKHELLSEHTYQIFLAVSILSMLSVPFIMALARPLAEKSLSIPFLNKWGKRDQSSITPSIKQHLIIIGFGLGGRTLAKAASEVEIPYEILENNLDTVLTEQAKNCPIHYGDATQETVLEHMGIHEAKAVVIMISDAAATRRVVQVARQMNPDVYIVARTRYELELPELHKLGADKVISEEFEASIEIFALVLNKYLIPMPEIMRLVEDIRGDAYQMMRATSRRWNTQSFDTLNLHMPDFEIFTVRLHEAARFIGKSLADSQLRNKYGLTLLALNRKGRLMAHPDGDTHFQPQDILVLLGQLEQLKKFEEDL